MDSHIIALDLMRDACVFHATGDFSMIKRVLVVGKLSLPVVLICRIVYNA